MLWWPGEPTWMIKPRRTYIMKMLAQFTGSVDSGRSTASEAPQPLFSAAAWRGLVGRMVRHLCIQAIGQCQLDVAGSNRSASAVKAWRRTQWAHLNTAAFRRTILASLEPMGTTAATGAGCTISIHAIGTIRYRRPQYSGDWIPARPIYVAARTMLHRRFHNELGLRSWPHQALLTALEKTMSGLSYRRYQHATLRLLSEEGRGQWWHFMAQARRPLEGIPSP